LNISFRPFEQSLILARACTYL